MAETKKQPVPEQNPVEVPLYTPWDVARYLRLPLATADVLSGWFGGWPELDFVYRYHGRYPHQLSFVDDECVFPAGEPGNQLRVSFRRFAELFVRAGVLHSLTVWSRARGSRPGQREGFHRSVWRGLEDTGRQPVPFDASPAAERAERLAEPFIRGVDENFPSLLIKDLVTRLDRVVVEAGVPVRLYPPTRDPAESSPRIVALDPRIRFGRPTVTRRVVPTDSLFERYLAGDSAAVLAKEYGLTPGEVEEAIRYESRPPAGLPPFSGW